MSEGRCRNGKQTVCADSLNSLLTQAEASARVLKEQRANERQEGTRYLVPQVAIFPDPCLSEHVLISRICSKVCEMINGPKIALSCGRTQLDGTADSGGKEPSHNDDPSHTPYHGNKESPSCNLR